MVTQGPSSLACSIELTCIYEHKQGRRSSSRLMFSRSFANTPKLIPSSPATPSTDPSNTRPFPPTISLPSPKPILRLTQMELRARREKSLCLNCDEQYLPVHCCCQSHVLMFLAEEELLGPETDPVDSTRPTPVLVEQLEHSITLNVISATKHSRGRAIRLEGFVLNFFDSIFC